MHMFLHLHGAINGAHEVHIAHGFAPRWWKSGAHEVQIALVVAPARYKILLQMMSNMCTFCPSDV